MCPPCASLSPKSTERLPNSSTCTLRPLDSEGAYPPVSCQEVSFEMAKVEFDKLPEQLSFLMAESPRLDIQPQRLEPTDKAAEVFISYAWGDDTPAGKTRDKTVQELYQALEEDGFHPIRDRDRIRPGERISSFIRQLTRADLVVTVISDKYLRSPYCMFEIHRLWERAQEDPDEMARCVVPIVLEEVRLGSFLERRPYLEYWSEQAETLEALIRDPKLRPGRESWDEVRLVRDFAHHVDDILCFLKDILMPRKLAVHWDDGFQAVREALRRRIEER